MDKLKQKRIKRITLLAFLGAFVVLAMMPVIARDNTAAEGPQQSILCAVVTTGDIATGIQGGGVLMEEMAQRITVPHGVKLTGFLVSNGDAVHEGDAIAQVDSVTVTAVLADTQQKLDLLARQIQSFPGERETIKLNAQTDAIVKAVYARKGLSVQDVILEHGSLMLLSLGGRMAVKAETQNVFLPGTAVSVLLEDGAAVNGKVDSCLDGELTVIFEDKGYEIGTEATLQTADGLLIGSGTLEIRDPLRIMAADGIVDRVAVSEGQWVEAGDLLLELTDAGNSADYGSLLAARQETEDLLQQLITLHYTNVVTATCDGVISGIEDHCPALLNPKPQTEDAVTDHMELLNQLSQGETEENAGIYIASVTPQKTATVTITVDEQDVLRLHPGMDAVVKIPALSETGLTAAVTEISAEGKNQGGSSKFFVKLTLPHMEQMLSGMNVTAAIPLETAVRVNRIPVAAVVDQGTKTLVYRGYDADKKTLTDPVEVVLGRSDGIYVEVLSGLDAGDKCYYAYYDTLELTDEPDFGVIPFAG